MRALKQVTRFAQDPGNRKSIAELIALTAYLNQPLPVVEQTGCRLPGRCALEFLVTGARRRVVELGLAVPKARYRKHTTIGNLFDAEHQAAAMARGA